MYRHGLVVGKFAPFHRGHEYLLRTALARSLQVTVLVYANPDFPDMPNAMRAGWIRHILPELKVAIPENPPLDAADDTTHRHFVRRWLAGQGLSVDAVFTSETYGDGFAAVLGVTHELVDLERRQFPISGRALRADPAAHADWLHPHVLAALVR